MDYSFLFGLVCGVVLAGLMVYLSDDEQDAFVEHEQQPIVNSDEGLADLHEQNSEARIFEPVSQADGYAVSGTPRHVPWSRRKKELEAGARQKRRQLEEFREEDNGR